MVRVNAAPVCTPAHKGIPRRLLDLQQNRLRFVGMDLRTALIEKLKRHPELLFSDSPGGVRIEAPTPHGFAVDIRGQDQNWTVYLGDAGFHEDFETSEDTLSFVAWCFSGMARLREVWRGTSPVKSVLEAYEDGEWRFVSETGFIFTPFWRQQRNIILENPNLLTE